MFSCCTDLPPPLDCCGCVNIQLNSFKGMSKIFSVSSLSFPPPLQDRRCSVEAAGQSAAQPLSVLRIH